MCESGDKDELKSAYVMPKEDVPEKRSTYIEKNTGNSTQLVCPSIKNNSRYHAEENREF